MRQYNELFNSTRPREYNGEHIYFVGMNPEISLRKHQRNAIAHVLYGGNTLLAHEVGAGKTFEMAASAMEAKRLGLCQKSLFVVPNHLTEQWAAEFLHLYPNAKLLVARRKDFETANRKKFCARIATGDYDAVIIGHSQFQRIPLSFERQERIIQEQIDEIQDAISELKYASGERFTVKQMEKSRKNLEQKLEKLRAADRKDDVITFEQLGVDRLFVDESHAFKNLFLYTKMRNVAGLSTSEAQKSSDMFGKCRYLDEVTGGRGVIFATGTPVSNSMTELYTVMRYLQYGTLQKKNLTHFDLAGFDERIANAENRLENLLQQQTAAQAEVEKPFPQEEELAQKSARLAELNAQLDVDEKHHEPEMEETPDEESARPSVLAALNEKSDKEEPVKPFRSYSDRDGDAR